MKKIAYFIDLQPEVEDFLSAIIEGFSKKQKSLPPKFFYDAYGSQVFDEICKTPEYYVTRTEIALMKQIGGEIGELAGTGSVVVEYGCGSSLKIRALFDALIDPVEYMAIDISKKHLINTAEEIAADYPGLRVGAICADFSAPLQWPAQADQSGGRRLAYFPGSTIGNQTPDEAREFLVRVRQMVGGAGSLLIGVDLKKDTAILNRAYNDAAGHTADFNLNLLRRMNNELGASIDLAHFEHQAFYNEQASRIEMHLVSKAEQVLKIDGRDFQFQAEETIHTENSYKYSAAEFIEMAEGCGFKSVRSWVDEYNLFSIHYLDAN